MVSKYGAMDVILPGLDNPLQILICVIDAMCDWKIGTRKRFDYNWVIDNCSHQDRQSLVSYYTFQQH